MQEDLQRDEIELDLGGILDDYLRCIKRYWLQMILATLAVAAASVMYFNLFYEPVYVAKLTYSVAKTNDTSTDAAIAKRLSQTVQIITSSREFSEEMQSRIEEGSLNKNFQISAANTEGANLFTIMVTANNYINANIIAELLEEFYPDWASRASGTVGLQIVDKTEASDKPGNGYYPFKYIIKGIAYGVFLCFIFASGYVFTRKTVRKESDMKKATANVCLGVIPEVKIKKRKANKNMQILINKKRVDWGFKQGIQGVQQRLDKRLKAQNKKVLLVASSLEQEGKSLLAVNLALEFAGRDKKTVLIDGDLRKPSVCRILEMRQPESGLSDYFRGEADIIEILAKKSENLQIIPAGGAEGELSAILDEDKMKELIDMLRTSNDVIIMDSPPTYMFSDAVLLSYYADALVYVVRCDYADVREVREGMEAVDQEEKILGYIMNRSQGGFSAYGRYGYGGYRYYNKYGRYGGKEDTEDETWEEELNTEDTL